MLKIFNSQSIPDLVIPSLKRFLMLTQMNLRILLLELHLVDPQLF